mgnify:CR=1 FL=1
MKGIEVNYIIFGKEKGEQGTEHLQGYVELPEKKALGGVKKVIGQRPHMEIARGNAAQNKEYCSKGKDIFEKGEPTKNGKTNLTAMVISYEAGRTSTEMEELYGDTWIRNKRKIIDKVADRKQDLEKARVKEEMMHVLLRDWQIDALNILQTQNDREVLFIIDPVGNTGKSFFALYLATIFNAFLTDSTKKADVLYAYGGQKYVALDLSRQQVECINYGTLDMLKNGFGFSPKYEMETNDDDDDGGKNEWDDSWDSDFSESESESEGEYESCVKRWPPAKVVVFSNNNIDQTKLSKDRYKIKYIENNKLV